MSLQDIVKAIKLCRMLCVICYYRYKSEWKRIHNTNVYLLGLAWNVSGRICKKLVELPLRSRGHWEAKGDGCGDWKVTTQILTVWMYRGWRERSHKQLKFNLCFFEHMLLESGIYLKGERIIKFHYVSIMELCLFEGVFKIWWLSSGTSFFPCLGTLRDVIYSIEMESFFLV